MTHLARLLFVFPAAMAAQWWWSTHGTIGGVAPQLLLVMTVAVSARYGPVRGMILGFFWGLFLDILAARLVGGNALAFTLVAYGTGSLRRQVDLLGFGPQCLVVAGVTIGYFGFMGLLGLVFLRSFLWVGFVPFLVSPFYNCIVAAALYVFWEVWLDPAR